ncbi:hypothetical protein CC1G_15547 [Coprinopsis cinerea okayama7|uniref:Uncharacterized protein n=1 Tax=Coprinopsis cinerea (strain Okayama-7 / 130 / ATCC MYA-4618 / FGSC 9003) TaxID=240176 RepID=D6RN51_COPC7|nr:hypothetical protein CC1G_15547 [Coprinopsis cinerea okayama7\|eukprot:XP_002911006.1 hypothetical protein CC1G_15547 [Coprinopsis cinerea okayama7\
MSSIPLLSLLERLPSYLLRTKAQFVHGNPLDHVAWNYADKKQTYRQFCQEMSTRFFNISQEIRFRDATGGSLRLALTFLRPWFYSMILKDFNLAVSTLRDLAIIIAHWGGQWWARDHAELNSTLDSMTFTLGEELLQRIKRQDMESSKLQDTVETLERIIRTHETERLTQPSPLAETCHQCASSPITPLSSPRVRPRRTMSMSISGPNPAIPAFHTPITPPDSRRNSWVMSRPGSPSRQPSIHFQPFTPPPDFPVQRSRAPSLSLSRPPPLSPLPATPPTPTKPLLPVSTVDEPIPEVASPVEQYEAPKTPVRSKERELSEDSGLVPAGSYLPTPPMEHDVPRTPIQSRMNQVESDDGIIHRAQVVSALPTPPLDSLFTEGLRARTLSDVSSKGLRILIPSAPTRLVFPPSPQQDGPTELDPQAAEGSTHSSPQTLASPFSETPSRTDSTLLEPSTLGSPIRLIGSNDFTRLPAVPASPAVSWGSAPTLPASPVTPEGSPTGQAKWLSKVSSKTWWSPRRTFSGSSLTPVEGSPTSASRSSLSEDAVKSPHSDISPSSPHVQVRTREDEVRYLTPRPGVKILASPIIPLELGEDAAEDGVEVEYDDKGRVRAVRRRRQNTILDTASTVVTGFLVGAFVTLFLVSTQRRTLLSLT